MLPSDTSLAELRAYLLLFALKAVPFRDLRATARQLGCRALLQEWQSPVGRSERYQMLVDRQIAWLTGPHIYCLHSSQTGYPPSLNTSPDPPSWLFVQGDIQVLHQPCLAVVGSRQASRLAEELTTSIGQTYADAGGCVVSGLARGVDTAAHKGALQAKGKTVSVFGCGLDVIYPRANNALARRIAESGACLSEYPPGTLPKRHQFPERNRIIAGLCEGALIIEAAARSGSLITARMALEAGREVFAIPGSIWDKRYHGSHLLIQQGAKLVQNIGDIFEELPSFKQGRLTTKQAIKAATEATETKEAGLAGCLLSRLTHQTASVEKLASQCSAGIPETAATLADLEISGKVIRQTLGYRLAGQIPKS